MDAIECDLEFCLFLKGLESSERDGSCESGYAHGLGCEWVDLCRDRNWFHLRV